ncbi:MAG TPA: Hsp70 family protein [Planctomycetota bacterium]|nr:Hsp70 family protein [Planctomycetota bacterium]
MSIAVGIDLGTTNSLVAYMNGQRPEIIPSRRGERMTPSAVFLPSDGGMIVGQAAKDRLEQFPEQTVVSIKRRMGTDYRRTINGKSYSPEEISAIILSSLKTDAGAALNQNITQAVITVPANFNSTERQATKSAGEIAGLDVIRVFNEPTAAALAYGQMNRLSRVVVVFDLGGGTFDISVVLCEDNVYEVLFSCGDNRLGGDDFNMRIIAHLVEQAQRAHGLDLSQDKDALRTLRREAILAKHSLSMQEAVRVVVPEIGVSGGQRVSLDIPLDRPLLKTLVDPLLLRLRGFAQRVVAELSQAKYRDRFGDIFGKNLEKCDVILVGGETRVVCVQEALKQEFAGKVYNNINPDEVVALGAAVQAGILQRHENVRDIVLVDSTSLSLGTSVKGGGFSVIIPANTPIPARRTREYFTAEDNQTVVKIDVYQGESSIAVQNKLLGTFDLEGLPARPKGKVSLNVTFDLDANDILNVEARNKETGVRAQTTIKGSQTISPEEVQRMKREAAAREQQNSEVLRLARFKADGEEALASLDRAMRPVRGMLHPDYVAKIDGIARNLRAALASGNVLEIERYFYDLMHEFPTDTNRDRQGASNDSLPNIGMQISTQSGFRAEEWSRLEVVLENKGAAPAYDIQVSIAGAIKDKQKGAVSVLQPRSVHSLPVSIFPTSPGSAVPLAIALEFRDASGLQYLVATDAVIEVARRNEPVSQDARMLINIGEIIHHAGGGDVHSVRQRIAGDNVAGGKAGDVVATRSEVNLGGTPNVPPVQPVFKAPTPDAAAATTPVQPNFAKPAPSIPTVPIGQSNPAPQPVPFAQGGTVGPTTPALHGAMNEWLKEVQGGSAPQTTPAPATIPAGVYTQTQRGASEPTVIDRGQATAPVSAPGAICPNCGMENPVTFKFCGGCGGKLERKKICASCGTEVPPGFKFCGNCGAKAEA